MIKKIWIKLLILAIPGILAMTTSYAVDQANVLYGKGFYIGGDLGYAIDDYDSKIDNSAGHSSGPHTHHHHSSSDGTAIPDSGVVNDSAIKISDSGFAWGINLGYFFNSYVGMELNYLKFPDYKITVTHSGGQVINAAIMPSAANLLVTGRLPLASFALFAQIGYGYLIGSLPDNSGGFSVTNSAVAAAAGVDYKFTPRMGVDLKWSADFHVFKVGGTFNAITAGFTYYI